VGQKDISSNGSRGLGGGGLGAGPLREMGISFKRLKKKKGAMIRFCIEGKPKDAGRSMKLRKQIDSPPIHKRAGPYKRGKKSEKKRAESKRTPAPSKTRP